MGAAKLEKLGTPAHAHHAHLAAGCAVVAESRMLQRREFEIACA
jgi:hypothetical protein